MSYCIFDTDAGVIARFLGVRLPGRILWPDGDRTSPASVGLVHESEQGSWIVAALEITGAAPTDYHRAASANGQPVFDQVERDGAAVTAVRVYVEPDLAEVRAALVARIDTDAEACRLRFITAGAGQAMTYQEKLEEARAIIADQAPEPGDYPICAASVGVEAATLADVAALVIGRYEAWRGIAATVEAARLGAKAGIAAAETVVSAWAVYQAATWPSAE